MYKLDSKADLLNISKKERESSITFNYNPKNDYFIHTLSKYHTEDTQLNNTRHKWEIASSRNITLKLFATKEGLLGIKCTLIGLSSVDEITTV